jgi:hypothetical protein
MTDISQVFPPFAFLKTRGLVQTEGRDGFVVMAGMPFSVRIGRDRGQVVVDIGDEQTGWHPMPHSIQYVDLALTQRDFGPSPSAETIARLLDSHWDALCGLFTERKHSRFFRRALARTGGLKPL